MIHDAFIAEKFLPILEKCLEFKKSSNCSIKNTFTLDAKEMRVVA